MKQITFIRRILITSVTLLTITCNQSCTKNNSPIADFRPRCPHPIKKKPNLVKTHPIVVPVTSPNIK